ncbi:hypothetical protein CSC67_07720 [Pusillimonas caeni]|uniref:hypothetical protein n=1 Tax=Pusillimonas caeni TaxID=1348472 RepID=UPI0010750F20|nr:hypothetical protein [Pusillimonas caeni]TFL14049.1 hypothetical protein CSC67_07720 [Pusillimonas caeni]
MTQIKKTLSSSKAKHYSNAAARVLSLQNEPSSRKGVPNQVRRLTDSDVSKVLIQLKHSARDNPEQARELLRRAGILTLKGKLVRKYGG